MELNMSINDVTSEFLQKYGVSLRVFREISSNIYTRIKIENFKISMDMTESEALDLFYNLPYSHEISKSIVDSLNLKISNEKLEEMRKQISFYILISSVLKLKRKVSDPILSLLYDRKGRFRVIGPVHAFVRKLAKKEKDTIENEFLAQLNIWDSIIKSNLQVLGLSEAKKAGRPSNKLEEYFLCEMKKILNADSKYYMNELHEIVLHLKKSYDPIFSELPFSKEAIKKSLQNFTTTIDTTART